jgi:tRNA pseudouridine38/39 synthase
MNYFYIKLQFENNFQRFLHRTNFLYPCYNLHTLFKMEEKQREDYMAMSKEELVERIQRLESCKRIKTSEEPMVGFSREHTRPIALQVAYLGFRYHGFVRQDTTTETVEHYLISALYRAKLIPSMEDLSLCKFSRCGRTDTGVSAFGQIVGVHVRSNVIGRSQPMSADTAEQTKTPQEFNYIAMINTYLPPDIRIIAWAETNSSFDARFSCKSRTYKYYFTRSELDIESMKVACTYFIGQHNFRNFCKATKEVTEYERTVLRAEIIQWELCSSSSPHLDLFVFTIQGHAFLYHQVRCMMGILFKIGKKEYPPSIVQDMLQLSKYPKKPAYDMASEIPLTLWYCEYDPQILKFRSEDNHKGKYIVYLYIFILLDIHHLLIILDRARILRHFSDLNQHYYMQGVTATSMFHALGKI